MTLYEVMQQIRNPVEKAPTPEQLVLMKLMEQLSNAVRNIGGNDEANQVLPETK